MNDRRLAGKGFKRQVPIGPHIADLVSFPLRMVIEIVPAGESVEAAQARRAWLAERGYRVMQVSAADIGADVARVIARIADQIDGNDNNLQEKMKKN